MSVSINVSYGELIDKITILEIKAKRISDPEKVLNIGRELSLLEAVLSRHITMSPTVVGLTDELRIVNESLWEVEDEIREMERQLQFDDRFIELARSVYKTNDRRSELKRALNETLGSAIVEEKSYKPY